MILSMLAGAGIAVLGVAGFATLVGVIVWGLSRYGDSVIFLFVGLVFGAFLLSISLGEYTNESYLFSGFMLGMSIIIMSAGVWFTVWLRD